MHRLPRKESSGSADCLNDVWEDIDDENNLFPQDSYAIHGEIKIITHNLLRSKEANVLKELRFNWNRNKHMK